VRHPICNDNFITVKIGMKVVRALVDTGSVSTLVSKELVDRLRLKVLPLNMENSFLVSANGTALEVIGKAEILINISGLQIPITARVVRHVSHQLILGADFMRQNQVIIDYKTGILSAGDDLVRAPLHSP